jgi:hypothetical protein
MKYKNYKKQYNTARQRKIAHPIFDSICMMHFIRIADILYKHKGEHLTAMHLMIMYAWWAEGRSSSTYKTQGRLPYQTSESLSLLIERLLGIKVSEKDIDNHMHYLCKYGLFHSQDEPTPFETFGKSYHWGKKETDDTYFSDLTELRWQYNFADRPKKRKLTLKNFKG